MHKMLDFEPVLVYNYFVGKCYDKCCKFCFYVLFGAYIDDFTLFYIRYELKSIGGVGLKKFIESAKNTFFYAGLSKEEYGQISDEINKNNRQSLMIFSGITCAFLLFMVCLSFLYSGAQPNRWLYVTALIGTAIVFLTGKFAAKNNPLLLRTGLYAFVGIIFLFGILLGILKNPNGHTVTFIALLLTVPLLFTDRPIKVIVCLIVSAVVFIFIAMRYKTGEALATDVINVLIFCANSIIVSTYMMKVKCQRFLYAYKLSVLSETDLLTGLHNRNSYEQNLKRYADCGDQTLYCIFIDVNGLHEMNNTKGHDAGDKMLQFIASALEEQFELNDIYRIGGDEFVVFENNGSEEDICRRIGNVISSAEKESYYISVGYEKSKGTDIDISELIKAAEKKMYEAKRNFYQQKGIDRRARA